MQFFVGFAGEFFEQSRVGGLFDIDVEGWDHLSHAFLSCSA